MKIPKPIFLISLLILLSGILIAQEKSMSKYSVQLDYGLSQTFHYKPFFSLTPCREGTFLEKQEATLASQYNLSIYRSIDQRNSLKFGVGRASYQFWKTCKEIPLLSFEGISQTNIEMNYTDFFIGYRHLFKSYNRIIPFVETDLIYERINQERVSLNKGGFAVRAKLGAAIKISKHWSVIVGGIYKTSIVNYSKTEKVNGFKPYGYGFEAGINYRF